MRLGHRDDNSLTKFFATGTVYDYELASLLPFVKETSIYYVLVANAQKKLIQSSHYMHSVVRLSLDLWIGYATTCKLKNNTD